MIVLITDEQVFSARKICQGCLMADHSGLPRWNGNKLGCGKALGKTAPKQTTVYKCQMGFNLTQVEPN